MFLSFFAHMQSTQAQIVYTDVLPDTVLSTTGTLSLDLNNDGIVDFRLITSSKAVACGRGGSRTNRYLRVTPAVANNAVLNNGSLPIAMAIGTNIDSVSQVWRTNASQLMAADTFRCTGGPQFPTLSNGGSGNFRNTTNRCLAVRFYVGTELHYGWIRFNVSTAIPTLKDYAYQSSANQSILAGQTGENYIYTSASGVSLFCAGDSLQAGYVILGNFDPANTLTVELSDSLGNFTKGTIIGSKTANISGTVPCKLPLSISGTRFRYRVISSNPAQTAADNGNNLTINRSLPGNSVTPASAQVLCTGSVAGLVAPIGDGNTYQWKKAGVNISGSTARNYTANSSGSFTCAISNGCGTVQSNAVSVTILPALPNVSITPAGPLTIKTGDSVVLSSSHLDTALEYLWYRDGTLLNTPAPGSRMTYTAKLAGNYFLIIRYPVYGCNKTSAVMVLTVQNVSDLAETHAAQSNINVQPNPFSSHVFMSFSIPDNQKFSVKIVDVAGRLVKTIASGVSEGGRFEYNWMADDQYGNLINSGVYFLVLETAGFSQTEKLILVR